jgi:hypothetical protein
MSICRLAAIILDAPEWSIRYAIDRRIGLYRPGRHFRGYHATIKSRLAAPLDHRQEHGPAVVMLAAGSLGYLTPDSHEQVKWPFA